MDNSSKFELILLSTQSWVFVFPIPRWRGWRSIVYSLTAWNRANRANVDRTRTSIVLYSYKCLQRCPGYFRILISKDLKSEHFSLFCSVQNKIDYHWALLLIKHQLLSTEVLTSMVNGELSQAPQAPQPKNEFSAFVNLFIFWTFPENSDRKIQLSAKVIESVSIEDPNSGMWNLVCKNWTSGLHI